MRRSTFIFPSILVSSAAVLVLLIVGMGHAVAHEPGDIVAFRWQGETRDGTYQIHPDETTPKRRLSAATPYFQRASTEVELSPERGRVAFAGGGRRHSNIYVANLSSGDTQQITFGSRLITDPSWSPDGRMIVADCGRQICIMRSDGAGRVRPITAGRNRKNHPQWSPDGTRIVFESHRGLRSIRPNGTGLRRLTRNRDDLDPRLNVFSDIVFTRYEDDGASLFVMKRNGSHLRKVTGAPGYDREADWSPDGSRIVFVRVTGLGDEAEDSLCAYIWTINPDGSNPQQLTDCMPHDGYASFFPTWSPDGEWIAFTRSTRPPGEEEREDVFAVDRNGVSVRNLTQESEPHTRYFGLDW